ncbi:hypothetical protein [Sphingobium sp. ba1]|jgi:hypothetical protein|uniref:hypothetical protein n=1 Tax=Sphingobium sp. ba1 TaxID=1522072 RepID=UPI0012E07A9F|nr:hypothetical protein [Sphingobium sp. ba1]
MGERRNHGIVTLDVESTPVFENGLPGKLSKEFQDKAAHASDWASYFPDRAWLAEQLASAEKSKGGAPVLFRPHEDRGWYFKRCLANLDLLTSAAKSGSIEVAIIHACELGRLMTEMEMKFNDFELGRSVEQLALSGQKVAAGGQASRKGRTRSQRFDAIKEYIANGKQTKAAISLVAQEDGVTAKAVEADYYAERHIRP